MTNCEICSTPLIMKKQSSPIEKLVLNGVEKFDIVRLSFRKGGEKESL